ncbi:MAG: serine/threonine-protein kinase [Geitlerinemataceae cyanobacterium]
MKEILYSRDRIIADRYRIVRSIGQGAFGITYEAEDLTDYKRVAMKVLSLRQTQGWKALDLFEREAQVLAHLEHPAIPQYLGYFYEDTKDDRHFYLIQELVEGDSLADLVKKGWHATEEQVRDIAEQVLEILDYLHWLNPPVIHRDIKPQNIIRRADGRVYLVDFGAVQDVYRRTLIEGGTFVGTLGYMPPEQFRGQAFFASDLYALGATLLFLLTHRSPDELPQKRMKIDFRDRVSISPEFANWLEKILEPAIEDRYKSANEALGVLRHRGQIANSATVVPTRQPPKGSPVVLQRSPQRLSIQFSSIHYKSIGGWLVIFVVSLPFLLLGFAAIRNIWVCSTLFLLVWIAIAKIWTMREPQAIELDTQTCRLYYQFLGWKRQIEKPIAEVRRALLNVSVSPHGVKTVRCEIDAYEDRYEFGQSLTPVEKRWLVGEISDFLERLHH